MNNTNQLVKAIQLHCEDYEFYPTTNEIIDLIAQQLDGHDSVLDVGSGDGRVLNRLTKGDKYAIEKSRTLLSALDSDVFVVGTDFNEQTLLDKRVDVVFSNPPYSVYEEWAERIVLEAQSTYVYLVIPQRWVSSVPIQDALKMREADIEVLGNFDFLEADRKARAVVDVIKITLGQKLYRRSSMELKVDPFELWFDTHFPLKEDNEDGVDISLKEEVNTELVAGGELIDTLEAFYQRDLDRLLKAYQAIALVDAGILKELAVDKRVLSGGLKKKTSGLKDKYWHLLFENLDKVTNRLTASSRKKLFATLTKNTHVDFTKRNAFAVLEWVIKNANQYYDNQLISVFETMVEKANVSSYKSNYKVFQNEEWRYGRKPDGLHRYKLDLRIILQRVGGLDTSWSYREGQLSERAASFVNDLCTVAYNLGYDTWGMERAASFEWKSGKKCYFQFKNHSTNEVLPLFEVKAFLNGNLHLKLNQSFICKLNVEFGRLKGWLKSKDQAASELDISVKDVDVSFNSNMQLPSDSILKLSFDAVA